MSSTSQSTKDSKANSSPSSSDSSFEPSIQISNESIDDDFNPLIPQIEDEKPLTMAELKMRYMRDSMLSKKDKYCQLRNLSTVCVTWNVNGREPQENLDPMLPDVSPDIFVLGLQEIDRRTEAYMSNISVREQLWVNVVMEAFLTKYPEEKFVKVASKALVGLFIIVVVRKEHSKHIGKISTTSASCGIMGVVGNKGAVSIRFKVYDGYLCFVNCHLAAHPNQVLRRNQDFSDLHKRLMFQVPSKTRKSRHDKFTDAYWHVKGFLNVNQCDVLYWLGDFNYRVEMEGQLARIFVQHGQIDSVLEKDQMKLQRTISKELSQYSEAEITFPPSYSFDTGTDNYDSSEKQRIPSWCDRIIWRTGDGITSNYYDCLFGFKSSDHKPVRFSSELQVNEIIQKEYETCYIETLKQMDTFENAAIPDTEISRNYIDAGTIPYHRAVNETFKIINRGRVMAQYRFISHEDKLLPNWIRINSIQGLIAPGQSEEITLSFIYDNSVARSNERVNEHILILHIEGGRDHFICTSFQCRETSFGKSLNELKLHRVILDRKDPNLLFKVPTILWRLVDFLIDQRALEVQNLFLLSGTEQFCNMIQDSLDLHEPFPEEINCELGYHSVAETILRFFNALPDSLLPSGMFEKCLQASKTTETTVQTLSEIPEINFMVFEYFMRFIRDILLQKNRSISHLALSQVIASALIRHPNERHMNKKELKDMTQFMSNIIH